MTIQYIAYCTYIPIQYRTDLLCMQTYLPALQVVQHMHCAIQPRHGVTVILLSLVNLSWPSTPFFFFLPFAPLIAGQKQQGGWTGGLLQIVAVVIRGRPAKGG